MKRRAFTLMEMMIVLAIIGLVFAGSVVGMRALSEEAVLKKPWDRLRPMAKQAWMRALSEQRAWQIRFYRDRFVLEPRQAINEDDKKLLAAADAKEGRGSGVETVALDAESGFLVEIRRWGQRDWVKLERDMSVAWVFEQSGLLEPLSVRFSTETGTIGGQFDPLTASLEKEFFDRESE